MNTRNRDSCYQLFNNLKILPPKSQYFPPLLLFVAKNIYIYINSEILNINLSKQVPFILELKFLITLGLQLDNQISWKKHVQHLIRKLSAACFLIKAMIPSKNIDSLKVVYFFHFHSVVSYGKIFWGNQHDINNTFIFQKRILRIMLRMGYRSSCRAWFEQLEILTVSCLCIYSITLFVIPCRYKGTSWKAWILS